MPDAPAPAAESPVTEATASAATTTAPESTEASQPAPSARPFSLGRALGLTEADGRTPVSRRAESEPAEPATTGTDRQSSAPSQERESKPSEAPTPGSGGDGGDPSPAETKAEAGSRRERREHENVARIRELEAEIASIKSAIPADEAGAPDVEARITEAVERARAEERERLAREQSESEQRRQQEAVAATERQAAERFERLNGLPDDHPLLAEGDNWSWLQEQKRLLSQFPQAQQMLRSLERTRADQAIDAARRALHAELDGKQGAFWAAVEKDMDTAADLPHVDMAALKVAKTFVDRNRLLHAAGAAWKEAEYAPKVAELEATLAKRDEQIARLKDDLRDLGLVGPRGLGSARAPVSGGRSAASGEAGPPVFDPQRGWRGNLVAALAPSNGRS